MFKVGDLIQFEGFYGINHGIITKIYNSVIPQFKDEIILEVHQFQIKPQKFSVSDTIQIRCDSSFKPLAPVFGNLKLVSGIQ